jgi:hypothetical protein
MPPCHIHCTPRNITYDYWVQVFRLRAILRYYIIHVHASVQGFFSSLRLAKVDVRQLCESFTLGLINPPNIFL